ncbi:uncharacterized protein GGS22DRAFT_188722 [Annulohypoxylon maeteangense]|uniref:uncharacterized protein n=1 Tax=Annulohypoxylon maeteangense TaxID=1927788 RepID=UPI0020089F77|nr:uncharacterized protein GGS22DRAFT_188722 [Annulohypoxylon maeteangense]KAI0884509.1 hypothetical protein GGS22DRAFT_188722 [Annulohypoxylon maeteangense]
MNAEILTLIRSQEAPGRDDYGKESKPPRAVLLDRIVSCNRVQVSGSQLLQLPTCILTDIADLLHADRASLGALALVNSTCQQLARSSQFSEVTFNYDHRSQCIIQKIAEEHTTSHISQKAGLGCCVRKFTMTSTSRRTDTSGSLENMNQLELYKEDNSYQGQPINLILSMLELAMPNLQVIEWLDDFQPNNHFLRRMMLSPAKSIKIGSLQMRTADTHAYIQGFDTSLAWPIRHLSFNPDDILFMSPELGEAILRSCAPTIEFLSWSQYLNLKLETISVAERPIAFPRLTSLQLNVVSLSTEVYLCFLSPRLRQLKLPFCYNGQELTEALSRCDTLRDLETLAIPLLPIKEDYAELMYRFIARHSHIRKLFIAEHTKAKGGEAHLDSFLNTFLSPNRFRNLTSLSLSWGGGSEREETKPHIVQVSFRSLCAVGKLTALNQLSLAAGILKGGQCQWLIDHDQMRVALGKLQNLRVLAISRDTYRHGPNPAVDEYYSNRFITDQDVMEILHLRYEDLDVRSEERETRQHIALRPEEERAWEKCHRNRMIREAERYSNVLRTLRWIYLGQRPMAIKRSLHGEHREIVPLTKERDSCFTYLRELFMFKNL